MERLQRPDDDDHNGMVRLGGQRFAIQSNRIIGVISMLEAIGEGVREEAAGLVVVGLGVNKAATVGADGEAGRP